MFDFTAKHSPANFPTDFFSLIRLSISFACLIAFSFSFKKMFRSFVFGVAIFFEKDIRFFSAVIFPDLICLTFVFRLILYLLFRLGI